MVDRKTCIMLKAAVKINVHINAASRPGTFSPTVAFIDADAISRKNGKRYQSTTKFNKDMTITLRTMAMGRLKAKNPFKPHLQLNRRLWIVEPAQSPKSMGATAKNFIAGPRGDHSPTTVKTPQ